MMLLPPALLFGQQECGGSSGGQEGLMCAIALAVGEHWNHFSETTGKSRIQPEVIQEQAASLRLLTSRLRHVSVAMCPLFHRPWNLALTLIND